MADHFRQFFLDTIHRIVDKEPSAEGLHELLKTVAPNITYKQVIDSSSDCPKAFKTLKLRIHPDKHPQEKRATSLFQNVQIYYDSSLALISSLGTSSLTQSSPNTRKRKHRSKAKHGNGGGSNHAHPEEEDYTQSVSKFPSEFSASTHWPHISLTEPHPPDHDYSNMTPTTLPLHLAYKCLHARGAIAHQTEISRMYSWNDVTKQESMSHSIRNVFEDVGGTKEVRGRIDIKQELMKRGPLVSVTFQLRD